jgi:hypothetical protein
MPLLRCQGARGLAARDLHPADAEESRLLGTGLQHHGHVAGRHRLERHLHEIVRGGEERDLALLEVPFDLLQVVGVIADCVYRLR